MRPPKQDREAVMEGEARRLLRHAITLLGYCKRCTCRQAHGHAEDCALVQSIEVEIRAARLGVHPYRHRMTT